MNRTEKAYIVNLLGKISQAEFSDSISQIAGELPTARVLMAFDILRDELAGRHAAPHAEMATLPRGDPWQVRLP